MRAGGPLDGVVSITALPESGGRCTVTATWVDETLGRRSEQLEAASFTVARRIAKAAASQLSLGRAPHLAR
jgi:hypothetical protein